MTTRRELLKMLTIAAAAGPFAASAAKATIPTQAENDAMQAAMKKSADAHVKLMEVPGLNMHGSEQIAMLIYPGFTALDLVGPHYFFASLMGATVHLVTTQADLAPVRSDLGLTITPTITMANTPKNLDVLFTPGGTVGTLNAAENTDVIAFMKDRGSRAKYVTSVCTGSFILGTAGLLKGKKATSHWVLRDTLKLLGATPVDARVVRDGNIITGAGVSAGLDFALFLTEVLRGRPYAEALMLQGEYAPEPPFKGGTLATTKPEIGKPMTDMFAPVKAQAEIIARKVKR